MAFYRPYRVIRILDDKILGSGIFLGQHVDLMENRTIFDRTHHIHFRLKNIRPWAKIGIFLLPNMVCRWFLGTNWLILKRSRVGNFRISTLFLSVPICQVQKMFWTWLLFVFCTQNPDASAFGQSEITGRNYGMYVHASGQLSDLAWLLYWWANGCMSNTTYFSMSYSVLGSGWHTTLSTYAL